MAELDPLVLIVGPTASGKSDLAIELCRRLDGEVVNADAMQLYRGMDIASAKVPLSERGGIEHHLIDVLEPADEATVAAFQREARHAVSRIIDRGRRPFIVGGSSLYVRAVIDPLDFPGTDPAVRARWTERLEHIGSEALHAELAVVAPMAAAQILPSNGRRIVRALEVTEITGQPFRATMPAHESVYDQVVMIGLQLDREELDERIARRVERMWRDGLLEEVRGLLDHGLRDARTSSRAIGYAQAIAQLDGELSEAEAKADTVRATRAFARRQDRLFRRDPRITWLRADRPDLVERAEQIVASGGSGCAP